MNILVNAIPIMGLVTGISRYLRALYHELSRIPGIRVDYFDGRNVFSTMPPPAMPAPWIKTRALLWKLPDISVLAFRSIHWLIYEYQLRRVIRNGHYDIYHETATIPARMSGIPMVFSVYDLSLITFRDRHPRERVWFHQSFLPGRLKYASHILTISGFIQSEIHSILKIPEHLISASHLAPELNFSTRDHSRIRQVLKKFNLPQTYFLFVGSLEPRKNLDLIIKAMALQENPLPLVLAGWSGWGDKTWLDKAEHSNQKNKIFLVGYVDDETLACLYSGAQGLIYPSLYEGFGLPVVEAMACGCPVICSNAASLPEVAGDAALLIDPHDPEALARAMDQLGFDPVLRQAMAKKGRIRAEFFSWVKTAHKTLKVFERVVNEYGELKK